ncbi:MAG: D-alanine--D-alanine ligase [Chloroflexi bacterium]|nr:D-alanine--D-alanine ligase [Chloroflexota bacterium]
MSARQRLGVLFGGQSPEHEISVISARSIMREADPERFKIVPLGITRGGEWLTERETRERLARCEADGTNWLGEEPGRGVLASAEAVADLAGVDVVFPIVHGRNGEDGTLQGLLELSDTPYVGAGVAGSAVGMDKAMMRAQFAAHGVPQPGYVQLLDAELADLSSGRASRETVADLERAVGYPCFVKPANGGSSIGVSRAQSREDLGEALREAARYDRKVLVEEGIAGREIECAVLGNAEPEASPLGEIRPPGDFYDFEAKYRDAGTELLVPAPLDDELAERIRQTALDAYRALDLAGFSRVDFLVREPHGIHVLEVNTLPGFTPISMFPRLWQEAGLSYGELITRLVDLGLERYEEARAYA